MYDPKNEAHEFTDVGLDEAIAKACQFYNLSADELEISRFPDGAVYGLAARALIVAAPKGRSPRPDSREPRDDREPRRETREGRGGRERGGRERGGRGRGDREDRPRRGRERGRERSDRPERPERSERTEPESSNEPSIGTHRGSLGEMGEFMLGVLERMGLGPFEISEGEENELTVIEVRGVAARRLTADEGRTVDALQLLANQVSAKLDPDRPRVVVDVEGNTDAREEFLTKLADRVAKRALQTGRPVALDPMNGRDRRTIHVALKERDDVVTMSEGEGRYRQVVVIPEGAEGFDDALAESDRNS